MIPVIEEVNMVRDKEDIMVFSTAMSAMNPSLDINMVAAMAAKEFLNSNIDPYLHICKSTIVFIEC